MQTHNGAGEVRKLELSTLEKSIAGLISTLVFAMLAWLVVTTNNTARDIAVLQNTISFLKGDAEKAVADRYTRADATADFRNIANQFREVDRRISRLEGEEGGDK